MSKLFVITFKRPALDIEKICYGQELTHAYDCEAVSIPEVAQIRLQDAQNKYEDVTMFECEDYEYVEFVKNEEAYAHFTRTGEHSMKPLEEGYKPPFALLVLDGDDNKWKVYKALESDNFNKDDFLAKANKQEFPNGTYTNNYIDAKVVPNDDLDSYLEEDVDVGTTSHSENIQLLFEMEKYDPSATFDYSINIDDVGQIVLTPSDPEVSFTNIQRVAGNDSINIRENDRRKKFALSLTTDMISDNNNFEWFCDIDDVGQAVITPDSESTSFLTVSINDSLNLVTECNEEMPLKEDNADTKELCELVITDLEELLTNCIEKASKIESYFDTLGIHSADIEPYMIRYLTSFISDSAGEVSVAEFRNRLHNSIDNSTINEAIEVSTEEQLPILDRIMKGDIDIYHGDGTPSKNYIHLDELDSEGTIFRYKYYYDEEADAVVYYGTKVGG